MQHALIRLRRHRSYADAIRAYQVVVDGGKATRIRRGQTIELTVQPGRHRIVLRIDWARSNYLDIDCRAGEVRELECGSSLTGMRIFLALFYILFLSHKYLWIRPLESDGHAMRPAAERPRLF